MSKTERIFIRISSDELERAKVYAKRVGLMQATKERFSKTDGRLAYHLIQSYNEGEITAIDAMKMGECFIEKYLGDAYETVYSVHQDHAHMHLHIIWNAVSYKDLYERTIPCFEELTRILSETK